MRLLLILMATGCAFADVEEHNTERQKFDGAKKVIVDNLNGAIFVSGYGGSAIEMEAEKTLKADSPERAEVANRDVKLAITREGDTVRIVVDGPFRCHCEDHSVSYRGRHHDGYVVKYDFHLKVPAGVFVDARTVNDGNIKLENTSGDFDVDDINGRVDIVDVAGSGRAHALNGGVKVLFAKNPTRASFFGSLNGAVDVTFRDGLSADVKMKTFNGSVYTDFPVTALPLAAAVVAERHEGKFVYKQNRQFGVRVGQGGPELQFDAFNGNIYIRKREQ